MDFFNQAGQMAIGSRLRILTDKITTDAEQIHQMYGIEIRAKWFPVFFVLAQGEAKTITAIAQEIGHSHPSVSNTIKEMAASGIVQEAKDPSDGRRNVVALSAKGKKMTETLAEECADMTAMIEQIAAQTHNDLWHAIEEWENLLSEKSLLERVKEVKKQRERQDIRITRYEPRYQEAFRSLNEEWINRYFQMEPGDYAALDNPQEFILDKGGEVFVALYQNEPVGVCALIKANDERYELSKLAVGPKAQGKGIGLLLGRAVVDRAKELGGRMLYLESNTVLKPAIRLYEKLGFKKVSGRSSAYRRCNIQMELNLK